MNTEQIRALTFDCYGTLIDWERGILSVLRPWILRSGAQIDDERLLSLYSAAEPRCEHAQPKALYPDILRAVLRDLGKQLNLAVTSADEDALANSVGDWPAFADTSDALQRLKRRFKLVIVSNVDRASFARTNKKLAVEFDAIVTAEEVGAYKPDPRMFQRALSVLSEMGVQPDQILHTAQSLFHDHVPAKAMGLRTAWVDRRKGKQGGATPDPGAAVQPDITVQSLAELATVLSTDK